MADGEICVTRAWSEQVCGGLMTTRHLNPHRIHFMPRVGCQTIPKQETTCVPAASPEHAHAITEAYFALWKALVR